MSDYRERPMRPMGSMPPALPPLRDPLTDAMRVLADYQDRVEAGQVKMDPHVVAAFELVMLEVSRMLSAKREGAS